jgi:hypothetical protein
MITSSAHCRGSYLFFAVVCFLRCSRGLRRFEHQRSKSASAERLLCRTGHCPANRPKLTGWENLPLAAPRTPLASANIPYALPPAPPTTFCPLSPEASLLLFRKNNSPNPTKPVLNRPWPVRQLLHLPQHNPS